MTGDEIAVVAVAKFRLTDMFRIDNPEVREQIAQGVDVLEIGPDVEVMSAYSIPHDCAQ